MTHKSNFEFNLFKKTVKVLLPNVTRTLLLQTYYISFAWSGITLKLLALIIEIEHW